MPTSSSNWKKRLSDIGREFDDTIEEERVRYEEKSKQYQRLIEKQQERLDRFEDKMKRMKSRYESEIEEYKTEITSFKRENSNLSSENSQRKVMASLTYQLVATRFELAEARTALKRREEEENGKENDVLVNNNLPESKTEKSTEPELYSKEMLYQAAEKGMRGLVQKILSPQQNYPDKLSTPLGVAMSKACVGGNVDVVKHLLQYGASVNVRTKEELYPLHFACRYGRAEVVKILIDEGADIDSIDSNGRTPLFHAAEMNHSECVELLLFAGCDITVRDNTGKIVENISADRALGTLRDHKMLFWNCCTRGNRVYVERGRK